MTGTLSDQLAALQGMAQMLPDHSLPGYAVGGLTPQAVAQPETKDDVSKILKWASRNGAAVAPWGGGTQQELGNLPGRLDLVLDVSRCNRVIDFQPEDLTVTVEAGITLEALQQHIAHGGKHLPLEAPQPSGATIGGILATGVTGPRRFAYGTPRDWLIGIGVIAANGVETKAGGRVVKNVTGYDLNKLYTGSLGTLGVIVEATFKLSPAPLYSRALIAAFGPDESTEGEAPCASAVTAAQSLAQQSHSPQGLLVLNNMAAGQMAHPRTQELIHDQNSSQALVLAFFEGRDEELVRSRLTASANLLGAQGGGARFTEVVRLNAEDSSSLLAQATGIGWNPESPPHLALKSNVPPSAVPEIVHRASQPLPIGQHPAIVADPGFGTVNLLWSTGPGLDPASIEPESDDPAMTAAAIETIEKIRDFTHQAGGTAVAEWCPPAVKGRVDVWDGSSHGDIEIQIMRRIKEKFDPAGILNPGRFLGGI